MASENEDHVYGVPDQDNPEMTEVSIQRSITGEQFFAVRGMRVPGRPKSVSPKVAVSLRLDQDVVEGFKATGPGWQTRMNTVLAASLREQKKSA
jgi:uncharacterized protein (DUF4415 family)